MKVYKNTQGSKERSVPFEIIDGIVYVRKNITKVEGEDNLYSYDETQYSLAEYMAYQDLIITELELQIINK